MGTTFDRVMREGRKATWLAERTGYSNSLISKVRSGERTPTPEFRRKVAEALAMPEDELFPDAEQAVA